MSITRLYDRRGSESDEADISVSVNDNTGKFSIDLSNGNDDENDRFVFLDSDEAWSLAATIIEELLVILREK